MKKINGFTRRPHILQILSYIIFFGNILIYSFIILPLSSLRARIISGIMFYLTSSLVVLFGYYTTVIDPTDNVVKEEKKCILENKIFDSSKYEYFCNTCETHVNEESKHCKQCERCVEKFDHHCKWVNNCIGIKNYNFFLFLIIAVMLSSTIFAIFSLILTYEYNYDKNDFIDKRAHFFNNDEQTVFGLMILMWIFTSITLILAILNTNLVFFHFWLIKNKMTTYEYILMRREKSGKKVDKKKFFTKVQKNIENNQKGNSPTIHSNVSNSNFPPEKMNTHVEGMESNSQSNFGITKPVDWRGKLMNLFNKPTKKNKVFTETSRNTELQNEVHNEEENLVPKISEFLIENTGCNVDVQALKIKNSIDPMFSSAQEVGPKNLQIKTGGGDEKYLFMSSTNERETPKENNQIWGKQDENIPKNEE